MHRRNFVATIDGLPVRRSDPSQGRSFSPGQKVIARDSINNESNEKVSLKFDMVECSRRERYVDCADMNVSYNLSCSSISLEGAYCGLMGCFQVPVVMLFDMLNIFALDLIHGRTRYKMDSVEATYRDAFASYTSPREIPLAAKKEDMSLPHISTLVNKNEFSGFFMQSRNRKVIGYRSTEPELAAKAIKL